ncbi:uncharacterized protein BDR25DRAFT_360830 [Lindgomyces ingoldianus]|uniref:Uncharacterized protein n=1 Tax=Lindgomyces ingoldianus TaxID=673940 RepID=A0ACB6QE50_9PLEO|nr:uncharacterized protein BDR25DRAFT_360830 [Lindgomyces ingoldianus]KAF2465196.1 hypothetical protein BDR25DRAFT_360830 [Lindgomyces ingoldianus]
MSGIWGGYLAEDLVKQLRHNTPLLLAQSLQIFKSHESRTLRTVYYCGLRLGNPRMVYEPQGSFKLNQVHMSNTLASLCRYINSEGGQRYAFMGFANPFSMFFFHVPVTTLYVKRKLNYSRPMIMLTKTLKLRYECEVFYMQKKRHSWES